MMVMTEMKGVCFLFSETGTEGGWWAMQEDGFVAEDGHWKYEGLRYLEEGDDFTVYGDDSSELFHGMIHQDTRTGAIPRQVLRDGELENHPTWKQQVVGGMWVHWIQKGIDPEAWGQVFIGNRRCLVRREVDNEDCATRQGPSAIRDEPLSATRGWIMAR
jgi:hypothetical protein